MRGTALIEYLDEVVPEYATAAQRYMGAEQGAGWIEQVRERCQAMARITIRPTWVGVIDFDTRFPN